MLCALGSVFILSRQASLPIPLVVVLLSAVITRLFGCWRVLQIPLVWSLFPHLGGNPVFVCLFHMAW